MSGLAGVVWSDGRNAQPTDAARLLSWLEYRGPDGRQTQVAGPAALGIARLHTTPESRHELQPLADQEAGLVVTVDGRLDNRDDLARALGAPPECGDAGLVARAFRRWDERLVDHLLGDFAIVVWDGVQRRLFAARDPMGMRPLHYEPRADAFRWASDAHALARDGALTPNEGMLGEMLADQVTSISETLFDGILRLPAGHALRWRHGMVQVWRYWEPTPQATSNPQDWDDELRSLMSAAVRARLRSDRPVALMLSGGVDSTIVASAGTQPNAPARLRAFSLTVPGHPADERLFFTSVASAHKLESVTIAAAPVRRDDVARSARRFLVLPEAPQSLMALPLRHAIADAGHRVVLTGLGGDEWFTGTQLVAADYISQRQWLRLWRRLRNDSRFQAEYSPARALKLAVWRLLHEDTRRRLRRVLRQRLTPPWIAPSFASRIALEDRLRALPAFPQLPTVASSETVRVATNGEAAHYREASGLVEGGWGFEDRHPFNDRRIIEFALGIAEEERLAANQTKAILRRAFKGALPEVVQQRQVSPDYSFVTPQAIASVGGLDGLNEVLHRNAERLQPPVARALYHNMITDDGRDRLALARASWPLWLMIAVDFWMEARAAAVGQSRGRDVDERVQIHARP